MSLDKIIMPGNSYEVIIWWSYEDAAYVVEVPELPGCMVHAKTRSEAIRQAEAAIRLWIKTAKEDCLEIPQPRGRLALRVPYQ
jgi:predicted RNase H-like HicB family nuclease